MKYTHRKDAELFNVPAGQTYRISCCDCGLVHDFTFHASLDRKSIQVTATRNNRATGQKRRKGSKLPLLNGLREGVK